MSLLQLTGQLAVMALALSAIMTAAPDGNLTSDSSTSTVIPG